jgi:threonine dehydrogenase-like Zn-dependent dehydrogenase
VASFEPGDRVLISCNGACSRWDYGRKGMYSHCTTGGWLLGTFELCQDIVAPAARSLMWACMA